MRRTLPDFELIRYVDDLVTACGRCGHEARVNVAEVIATSGPNTLLGDLRRQLHCRQCGARAASLLTRSLPLKTF